MPDAGTRRCQSLCTLPGSGRRPRGQGGGGERSRDADHRPAWGNFLYRRHEDRHGRRNVSTTMRHGKRNNSWSVRLLFRHSQHSAMRVRCSAVSRASSDAVRTASSAPCWSSAARQVSRSLWRRSHRDGVPLRASSVAAPPAH